jgi:hypothetical protein
VEGMCRKRNSEKYPDALWKNLRILWKRPGGREIVKNILINCGKISGEWSEFFTVIPTGKVLYIKCCLCVAEKSGDQQKLIKSIVIFFIIYIQLKLHFFPPIRNKYRY